jgi:energy-coupling factor transport system substrate-specific component
VADEIRHARFTFEVGWITAVASLVGLAGFLYPFLLPAITHAADRGAHAADAPYLFALITVLCVIAIAAELDGGVGGVRRSASKSVALLGVLVATDATLRLVPSFLGGSPIFLLVILVGAVFGPAFGFQMGALTLLVSAFITGGVGPWLPYEMLGVGWVGLTAGWLPRLATVRRRLLLLAAFGALWGFLYGAILNLWSWPFAAPGLDADVGLYWSPTISFRETLAHYGRFYLVTSLWYDLFRAIGNAVLVLTLGGPTLRVLERFRARFSWEPWTELDGVVPTRVRGSSNGEKDFSVGGVMMTRCADNFRAP